MYLLLSWPLQVLRRDLTTALRKKRPGVPLEHFILHMDNASAHTSAKTELEVAVMGFGRVAHPPYSPDLAPFDFAIFPAIKSHLKGRRFESLQELSMATREVTSQYKSSWYADVYRQWVHRHQRCIEHAGAYFEKC
jgi:histone-lysine N-methyltransferase SETMAR